MVSTCLFFRYPTYENDMHHNTYSLLLKQNAELLSRGQQKGLTYFYDLYGKTIYWSALRATDSVCDAESILQECFLKLWMMRGTIIEGSQVIIFLRRYANASIKYFHSVPRNNFNRSMLRFDGIERFESFVPDQSEQMEDDDDVFYDELQQDMAQKRQIEKVKQILPSLGATQRLFLELCLHYNFDYERIAHHMGGISGYAVAKKVEQAIEKLRGLLQGMEKIDAPT